MTDKEWYVQLSTLVLEGIDLVNNDKWTYQNQVSIRRFVTYDETPTQRREKAIQTVKEKLAIVMMIVGYVIGAILMIVDILLWIMAASGNISVGNALLLLIAAVPFGAVGIAGHAYTDIHDAF